MYFIDYLSHEHILQFEGEWFEYHSPKKAGRTWERTGSRFFLMRSCILEELNTHLAKEIKALTLIVIRSGLSVT